MRKARWLQVVFFTTLTFGQTMIDLRTQSKSVDFTGANTTKPLKSGTVLPATCGVGEMFYLTSAPAGANIYGCPSPNSWVLEAGSQLPTVSGNAGRVLSTDGSNYLWSTPGGDLSGPISSATVLQIQGRPVASSIPQSGQFLGWNGSVWLPQTVSGAGSGPVGGDLTGTTTAATVIQIQGRSVSNTAPANGQILTWNGSNWTPQNAPSGGGNGSGASLASQLGDLQVLRSNGSTLTVGSNCSSATPCNVRFGTMVYTFTSGANLSVSGGSGLAYVYVTSAGALTVGTNSLTVSCGTGCITQSGVTAFPPDSIALASWNATNGSWDSTGLDQRAFLSFKEVTNGPGISVAPDAQGHTIVSADPNVIPLRTNVPASANAAGTPGSWAADTTYFYICVSPNVWRRAALSAW